MKLAVISVLVLCCATVQSQGAGKGQKLTPLGPDPDPTTAANPWQILLQKMMDLLANAANATHTTPTVKRGPPPKRDRHIPRPPPMHGKSTTTTAHTELATTTTIPPAATVAPTAAATTMAPVQITASGPTYCFWEQQYYELGSDIVRGQHDRWCYVTYCDSNGKVQFWDDYNCPPNSMKPTSSHSSGRKTPGQTAQQPSAPARGPPQTAQQPSAPGRGPPQTAQHPSAPARGPPQTAQQPIAPGRGPPNECEYRGAFYQAGQEIGNHRVGDRCYGTYCNHDVQVINWEDWCTQAPASQGQGQGHGRGAQQQQQQQPQQQQQQQQHQQQQHSQDGCYHNELYYSPNEDVISGKIGDMCYGYYCEGFNTFVHWEDQCSQSTVPPHSVGRAHW